MKGRITQITTTDNLHASMIVVLVLLVPQAECMYETSYLVIAWLRILSAVGYWVQLETAALLDISVDVTSIRLECREKWYIHEHLLQTMCNEEKLLTNWTCDGQHTTWPVTSAKHSATHHSIERAPQLSHWRPNPLRPTRQNLRTVGFPEQRRSCYLT